MLLNLVAIVLVGVGVHSSTGDPWLAAAAVAGAWLVAPYTPEGP